MSSPGPYSSPNQPSPSWGEDGDRTTIYQPGAATPSSGPQPTGTNPDPSATPEHPEPGYGYGYGAPAGQHSGPTAVYPPAPTPPYAPQSQPQPYAMPVAVPPPAYLVPAPTQTSSAAVGFAAAAIGLILTAAGLFLALKYGTSTVDVSGTGDRVVHHDRQALALLGALVLLAAAVLNGWSYWATLIPGILVTGAGVYGLFSTSGGDNLDKALKFAFDPGVLSGMAALGLLALIGLLLLGASVGAAIARGAGRRAARQI